MKSSYAIAYRDKSGRDFNGLPWILDDIQSEADCIENAKRMVVEGYKEVIPFKFSGRRKPMEEFDWDYVKCNRIQFSSDWK